MRKIVFLVIFFLFLFLFFGLFNKNISSQENNEKDQGHDTCKIIQIYINNGQESIVNSGSKICKTSKGTLDSELYYASLPNISLLVIQNNFENLSFGEEDHKKYFECKNGRWEERKFDNKECMMKERKNVWSNSNFSQIQGYLQVEEKRDFISPTLSPDQNNDTNERVEKIKEVINRTKNNNCGKIGDACCVITNFEDFKVEEYLPNTNSITFFISFISKNTVLSLFKSVFTILGDILGIKTPSKTFCYAGYPSDNNIIDCRCIGGNEILSRACLNIKNDKEKEECIKCVGEETNNQNKIKSLGIWTVFGCFYGDFSLLIKDKILNLSISLGGLIALICIIYSGIQIQTSQGSPEKIKKAQELLTSCIMGLMVIIFSVFILKVIGVDILKIPGFGK